MYSQSVDVPLQDLDSHVLTVEAYEVPTAKLEPFISTISTATALHYQEKHSAKAGQSTLGSGSSEHVVI